MAGGEREHLYVEIAEDLRRRIRGGEWAPGARITGHRTLRDEYGVSDTVMSAARQVLISEGVLESRGGAGTYVRRQRPRRPVVRTANRESTPRATPLRAQEVAFSSPGEWSVRTDAVKADPEVAGLLGIPTGDQVMRSSYRFRSHGQVVRTTVCWEPHALVGSTAVVLPEYGPHSGQGVPERMAAIGVTVASPEESVIARPASEQELDVLGRGASPILEVTRTYRSTDGLVVHVERTVLRGDASALVYQL
jgi:GntR family transcriptional regulator